MNVYLLFTLLLLLLTETLLPQPRLTNTNVAQSAASKGQGNDSARIKWTWQLPAAVKDSFKNSRLSNWFIEKMVRYNLQGIVIYRFYLNNGNLLDGDHHDCFLKTDSLDITSDVTVLLP